MDCAQWHVDRPLPIDRSHGVVRRMRLAVLAAEHSHAKSPLVPRMLPRPDKELARLNQGSGADKGNTSESWGT